MNCVRRQMTQEHMVKPLGMSTLRTTIREKVMPRNRLPPVHPGEIIRQDILPSSGLSVTAVAKAPRRVSPDASRHSGGAQTAVSRHVPEGVSPVWQHARVLDAIAGSL